MASYEAIASVLLADLKDLVDRGEDPETVAQAALKAYSMFRCNLYLDAQHKEG